MKQIIEEEILRKKRRKLLLEKRKEKIELCKPAKPTNTFLQFALDIKKDDESHQVRFF